MPNHIKFYKFSDPHIVADILAEKIKSRLKIGQRVLWLVSGGSAIKIANDASKKISVVDQKRLIVALADERFGQVGHKDSNWQKLMESGFKMSNAHLHPVLTGSNLIKTALDFNDFLSEAYARADFKLALLGLGTDGHTAGILPRSPVIESKRLADSYSGEDYQRITITPFGLGHLNEAVVFAQGEAKSQALDELSRNLTVDDQPAQIIKQIPLAAVYNDLVGETI